MGLEKFATAAASAGADGVLITDITPEESGDYRRILRAHRLDTVFLGAPTSTDDRLAKMAACSSGFLYLISRTGVTGGKDALPDDLPALLRRARSATQLPIAVGFGISLPGHVSVLGGLVDAAVVGSALVSEIENATAANSSPGAIDSAASALTERIRSLKSAARAGLSRCFLSFRKGSHSYPWSSSCKRAPQTPRFKMSSTGWWCTDLTCIAPLARRTPCSARSGFTAISITAILSCWKGCAKSCASLSRSNWPAGNSSRKARSSILAAA